MNRAWKLTLGAVGGSMLSATTYAQVPDLLTSFDAGGSSLGMGGSLQAVSADTLSAYYNPAGLGYISGQQFGLNYRNLPHSNSVSSGNFNYSDRFVSTNGTPGSRALTHAGIAVPLSELRKHGGSGVIALTYTVGGQIDDVQTSSGLTYNPTITITNYELDRSAQSDFFTLAYGKTNAAQTFSFGIGLNYVQQRTRFREVGTGVDQNNNPVGLNLNTDNSDSGYGYGVTIGLQGLSSPKSNTSWGVSYRSPVDIKGAPNTGAVYGRIPGRVLAGVGFRNDGLRGGKDYVVFGGQVAYFFDGESSPLFDRTNQTTGGVGLEYNLVRGSYRLPIRFGYAAVPSGGNGFGARSALTYGIGYRPNDGRFNLDVNFAAPENGGYDTSISLTYRFDK